jgi:hypothetical protein
MKNLILPALLAIAYTASAELIPAAWASPAEEAKAKQLQRAAVEDHNPTHFSQENVVVAPEGVFVSPRPVTHHGAVPHLEPRITAVDIQLTPEPIDIRVDPEIEGYVISAELAELQQRVQDLYQQKVSLEGEINHINLMRESALERNLGLEQELERSIVAKDAISSEYEAQFQEMDAMRSKQIRKERDIREQQLNLVVSENKKLRDLVALQDATIQRLKGINEAYGEIRLKLMKLVASESN